MRLLPKDSAASANWSAHSPCAQTQASCRQGGIVAPQKGAPIVYGCMMEIGRTLSGWLEGVDLDAVKQ